MGATVYASGPNTPRSAWPRPNVTVTVGEQPELLRRTVIWGNKVVLKDSREG